MREIQVSEIIPVVEQLCISSNRQLNADVYQALQDGFAREESPTGKDILHKLLLNADMAREQGMAMCQDTGMTVIFCELGQDVHLTGGDITEGLGRVEA